MINLIPDSWNYNDSLEMLFMFYQCSDELLSKVTPDTYSLPQHNAVTLIFEMDEIYNLLDKYAITDTYYSRYIPPIIDEFLFQLEEDYLLKRILDKRLSSIRTGFEEAKSNSRFLEKWLGVFKQACTPAAYRKAYKCEIERLVLSTKDKRKLLYCARNYYICLITAGYSREFLYTSCKRFFDNKGKTISDGAEIKNFLKLFSCKKEEFTFLVLMDIESIEYLDSLNSNIMVCKKIKKVDLQKERTQLCKDYRVAELFRQYDSKIAYHNSHKKISIVYFNDVSLDPYSAAFTLEDQIRFLQSFSRYFKHFNYSKQIFRMLVKKDDGSYYELRLPSRYQERPYVSQSVIDSRIKNILSAKSMGLSAFNSIAQAIDMHAEALDSKSTSTLIRTFWTALETLFSNPSLNSSKENVINSVIPLIQKTYILKVVRLLYSQLTDAIGKDNLNELGINDFSSFVLYYSSFAADSPEMKRIYSLLSNNPLLRSRLYEERNLLKSGRCILKMLDNHSVRIEWQLKRLYRIRNIATHLGYEPSGCTVAVNHLHNYFDYTVNYLLCKSESGDWIDNISSVVFEAQNDNRIHRELLKSDAVLSKETYLEYLFGPDKHLITYQFS